MVRGSSVSEFSLTSWSDESIDDLFHEFRATYIQIASDSSRDICWLPGARDLIQHLQGKSVPIAILTNKPRSVTDALLPRLEAGIDWSAILCPEDAGIPKLSGKVSQGEIMHYRQLVTITIRILCENMYSRKYYKLIKS